MHRLSAYKLWLGAAVVVLMALSLVVSGVFTRSQAANADQIIFLVTNWGEDSVSIVDITAGKELARIPVGLKPFDAAITSDGSLAYISDSGEADLTVLDLKTQKVTSRIAVGRSPRDLKFTKDLKFLVVANSGDDTISLVSPERAQEFAQIPVGRLPFGVALTPDGRRAYVANWGENSVSVVDLLALKEMRKIPVGALPYTIIMHPEGTLAFTSNFASSTVSVINTQTNEVTATIPVGGRSPWGITLSPDAHTLATANYHSGDVSLLTVNPHYMLQARIPMIKVAQTKGVGPTSPKNARYTSNGQYVVVTNLASNNILVIDAKQRVVVRTIKVGQAPYGLAEISPHPNAGK